MHSFFFFFSKYTVIDICGLDWKFIVSIMLQFLTSLRKKSSWLLWKTENNEGWFSDQWDDIWGRLVSYTVFKSWPNPGGSCYFYHFAQGKFHAAKSEQSQAASKLQNKNISSKDHTLTSGTLSQQEMGSHRWLCF